MLERIRVPGARAQRKLVFVNRFFHPDQSATSRLVSDLAFRLAQHSLRIEVVTSRQLYDEPGARLARLERVAGVTIRRVRTANRGRLRLVGRALDYASFHLSSMTVLARLLAPGDLVVAMTDPPLLSISVSRVARLRGARCVNWLQDIFPEVATALDVRLPRRIEAALTALRDASLRGADLNIALGERMREHLLGRGLASERVRTLPNWADTAHVFPMAAGQSMTRARLGWLDRFVVGYSGNLGRAHEFDTLLRAAKQLRDDQRFAFLIVGGGARLASLKAAVEADRLENVRFLPYQPPAMLADSLGAADVHLVSLLPSLEGLIVPSKLYGILAAGRPTLFLGDADGEVARVLREAACGLTVRVGDDPGLASALRALADAPERCAEMGRRARELAIARYSSERACAAWCALLSEITPAVLPDRTAVAGIAIAPAGARN